MELFPLRVVDGRGNTAQERLQHRAIGQHVTPEPRHDVPNLRKLARLLGGVPREDAILQVLDSFAEVGGDRHEALDDLVEQQGEYVERAAIVARRFDLATNAIDATHALTAARHNQASRHVHADRTESLRIECEVVVQVTEDHGEPAFQHTCLDACLVAE